ncbi:MAG: polyprenyl synthetase family protein [Bdellovibrio sp.]|nr:polyprenyl synthetase family protein [Bdellovibrio sp.]
MQKNDQHMLLLRSVQDFIAQELAHSIKKFSSRHLFQDILHYAVCPPGKLFRPLLAWGVASDLAKHPLSPPELHSDSFQDILTFTLALEFHHAYSLTHDDLPSMDNDRYRRGKLATHAQYGEWQAILAGDGLLNLSYYCLSKLKSTNQQTLLALMGHALGPKGLVLGQVMDMNKETIKNLDNILIIHELKTARLFQVALTGSFLLLAKTPQSIWSVGWHPYWRLGRSLGIVFQLIDDLTELCEGPPQTHEKEINPWPHHYYPLCASIRKELAIILKVTQTLHMQNLRKVWHPYFSNFVGTIETNQEKLFSILSETQMLKKNDLQELIGALQSLNLCQ